MIPLVLLLQTLAGMGLARRWGTFPGLQLPALGLLLGLPLSSLVVFFIDVIGIPIGLPSFLLGMILLAAITNADWLRHPRAVDLRSLWPESVAPYEWPAIFMMAVLCLVSFWRCVLLPVIPRDAIVGMDLVAKYAVAEGTLNSSVFTGGILDGHLSNQPYYAPFTALMQIVFRLAGMASGKLWIAVMFAAFTVFLYARLKDRVHPLVAGFLVVALISTQGFFTYSFVIVTDFANALFFGLCVLFVDAYARSRTQGDLLLSALFLGFACWSRSETVLLVPLGAASVWVLSGGAAGRFRRAVVFAAVPVILFLAWHWFYFTFFLGSTPSSDFMTVRPTAGALMTTLGQMVRLTFVSKLLGTLPYLFVLFLALDSFVLKRWNGRQLLVWMAGVVVMLLFVVQAFPAASMEYTGKRGFLKVLVIMALYVASSPTMGLVSQKLEAWGSRIGGTPRDRPR